MILFLCQEFVKLSPLEIYLLIFNLIFLRVTGFFRAILYGNYNEESLKH